MRKVSVFVAVLVALTWLAGAGLASAQGSIDVDVSGLPEGTQLEIALSFANLNKTQSAGTTGTTGTVSSVLDFANLGKTASQAEEQTQVYVYYNCEEDQLLFSDTPRDDEDCQNLGIIYLSSNSRGVVVNVANGTAQVLTGGGGGIPWKWVLPVAAGAGAGAFFALSGDSNKPPTAACSVSPTGTGMERLTTYTFNSASSDPDGDPVTSSWNFGDGTTGMARALGMSSAPLGRTR